MIRSGNCGRPSKIQNRRRSRSQQGATLSNRTLRPKNKKFRGQAGEDFPRVQITSSTREASADVVAATKRRSATVKALTNADERIEDQKQLAETYQKWIDVVTARQRTLIHSGLAGAAVIVAI